MPLSQRRARLIARLRDRKSRVRERAVLVEGVRAAAEALDAGAEITFAVTSPRLLATEAGKGLAERIAGSGLDDTEVGDDELAAVSDTEHAQGILLVCTEPSASLPSLDGPRVLILDGVQDPGNAGTLVRGAVAFGLDAVVCLDGTADPWGPKAVRASAGSVFRVRIASAALDEALRWLGERRLPLLVADARGVDVARLGGMVSFALAIGNEGAGVREALAVRAQASVSVPMTGPVESLNAGVAGSILMHCLTKEASR